jgi:hypothetical protein
MTLPARDIALTEIKEWSPDHVRKLARIWIVNAGHVVALGATPEGARSLAEHLGIAEEEARRLVTATEARLAAADTAPGAKTP